MTTTSIVCLVCHALVPVVDRVIAQHGQPGDCPASGMRYVPSRSFSIAPGGPKVEIVASGPMKCSTPGCESEGMGFLAKITLPRAELN